MKNIADINQALQSLEDNEKKVFQLGKKKYKIARLSNWTSRKINRLIFQLQSKRLDNELDILGSDEDRKLMPKIISLAILRRPWRIKLFHWFLWRKLDKKYNQKDYLNVISIIIDNSDMNFFSKNLASLHLAAMMETEITKVTITNIAAKLKSEQETT
ncbi:MAG: hypothetical protein IKY94_11530 [Lachnospiraceae bacterium]|jgi:hypothetical protein|nr:hypothetical protein [Lachnospiraceae bacterium]